MNKQVLITGANSGLGFETAKALLSKGYTVVMANRSRKKSRVALEALRTLGYGDRVTAMTLDLEDRTSIVEFVEEYLARFGAPDILINNAGVFIPKLERTKNGVEKNFDINYLGHFYLDSLLVPKMKEQGLVISLSSLAHKHKDADIYFEDFSFRRESYSLMKAYGQSKLALALMGMELSRRMDGSGRRSVVVHPGVSNTNLFSRYLPKFLRAILSPLARRQGISLPEEGARSIVYAATEPLASGCYVGPQGDREWAGEPGICSLSDRALDPVLAGKLWKASEDLLGIRFEL